MYRWLSQPRVPKVYRYGSQITIVRVPRQLYFLRSKAFGSVYHLVWTNDSVLWPQTAPIVILCYHTRAKVMCFPWPQHEMYLSQIQVVSVTKERGIMHCRGGGTLVTSVEGALVTRMPLERYTVPPSPTDSA